MRRSLDKDLYAPPVCCETSLQEEPVHRSPDLSAPYREHLHHGLFIVEEEPEGTPLPIVPIRATDLDRALLTVRSPIAKARCAQEPPGSRLEGISVAARPALSGAHQLASRREQQRLAWRRFRGGFLQENVLFEESSRRLARSEGRFFGDTLQQGQVRRDPEDRVVSECPAKPQ